MTSFRIFVPRKRIGVLIIHFSGSIGMYHPSEEILQITALYYYWSNLPRRIKITSWGFEHRQQVEKVKNYKLATRWIILFMTSRMIRLLQRFASSVLTYIVTSTIIPSYHQSMNWTKNREYGRAYIFWLPMELVLIKPILHVNTTNSLCINYLVDSSYSYWQIKAFYMYCFFNLWFYKNTVFDWPVCLLLGISCIYSSRRAVKSLTTWVVQIVSIYWIQHTISWSCFSCACKISLMWASVHQYLIFWDSLSKCHS